MRKILSFVIVICFFSISVNSKNLQGMFSYSMFFVPGYSPYLETYLGVSARSVKFLKNDNGKFQAAVEISIIFRQDTSIKAFKKYILKSQEIDDSLKNDFNFIDAQRFVLKNGKYNIELKINDFNNKRQTFVTNDTVVINFDDKNMSISGIENVESYKPSERKSVLNKDGYEIIPFINNFYSPDVNNIKYYFEIYNAHKEFGLGNEYEVKTYVIASTYKNFFTNLNKSYKIKADTINVVIGNFILDSLPSGNYYLVAEITDKSKLKVTNRMFFQRSNPKVKEIKKQTNFDGFDIANTFAGAMLSRDTLSDYINSLYPIADQNERIFIDENMKKSELQILQRFFYGFWYNRNVVDPEREWIKYSIEVKKVNSKFGTRIKRGYATDRGRVYLQYGPPNTIVDEPTDVDALPYQIWHYYSLGNQQNRKFVFYEPDLVTNDYQLLHSNAQGELNDVNWLLKIYYKGYFNVDQIELNTKAKQLYDNPR